MSPIHQLPELFSRFPKLDSTLRHKQGIQISTKSQKFYKKFGNFQIYFYKIIFQFFLSIIQTLAASSQ